MNIHFFTRNALDPDKTFTICCTLLICVLSIFILSACSLPNDDSNSKNSGAVNSDIETERISGYDSASCTEASTSPVSETSATWASLTHENSDFVEIKSYIPDIIVDLKYATNSNFTGSVIYSFKSAYIRYGTLTKLSHVAEILRSHGYRIKIWDAFRPFEAQVALWNAYPDGNYVANPAKGYTSHNLGNTLDLTITYMDGTEIDMPTPFDDFSAKADRNYSDVTLAQATNSAFLESIMTECGFKGYINEWWHYEDIDTYTPDTSFLPPN